MAFLLFLSLLLLLFLSKVCRANDCPPSSCGSIRNISYPFRLNDDPKNCGDPSYELACENNQTTVVYLNSKRFHVLSITYYNFTIRLVDPGLLLAEYRKGYYSSCPLYYLTSDDITSYESRVPDPSLGIFRDLNKLLIYISCSSRLNRTQYSESAFCGGDQQSYSYAFLRDTLHLDEIENSCSVKRVTLVSNNPPAVGNSQFSNYTYGFELMWYKVFCRNCDERFAFCDADMDKNTVVCQKYDCYIDSLWRLSTITRSLKCMNQLAYDLFKLVLALTGMILVARCFLGVPFLLALLVYKNRRMHLSMNETIEKFLKDQNNLVPIRYSYAEVKRISNKFRDKLGEGGYGTVFKGKLRSGLLVAVKMLGKSNASGEEFISEVATVGRIHHVNVVNLIGFCFEGSKRALIYEFMPNGSLDKYIFPQDGEMKSSSWEKMFKISLGIARGMDYLHRGCEMQILHFDIKPHNILLDENFNPKISDFGLAKLYPANDSIVSLTAARGTMGYMAPELFYKNIGRVSYKADVYSFGMLLMEMAGKRKNLNPFVDHLSQIYFPSWVHDKFSQGKEIEMGDATEDERKLVKKMILVALWCIQMRPTDRPSMNKVVEMLEGDVELLEMPAKPFLSPGEMHQDHEIDTNNADLPLLSTGNRDSARLDVAI